MCETTSIILTDQLCIMYVSTRYFYFTLLRSIQHQNGKVFFQVNICLNFSALISLRGRPSSGFYTHETRITTIDRKNAFSCLSTFSEAVSHCFFLKFFWKSIKPSKQNLIKTCKKIKESFFLGFKYIKGIFVCIMTTL